MKNAFSVDVEDYYQVGAFAGVIAPNAWDTWESHAVKNTRRLLEILQEAGGNKNPQSSGQQGTRATFFILGWIAERFPELVKEIAAAGHEIASHGYGHQLVYTLSEDQFREDVRSARKLLQDISGQPVFGYRAPSFSIVKRTPWAHRILAEEGHLFDSSVFPIHHDLHGNPDAPREIHTIQTEAGPLNEFPPAVITRFGLNIPAGGGGYFRFFPYWVTRSMLREVNNKLNRPFVFYIHPWEIDTEQPRISGASLKSRFRHYLNLHKTAERLKRLLNDFEFGTVSEVLSLP